MSKAIYGGISLWGIYGGIRGWHFYSKEYELKSKLYKKKNEELPNFYPLIGRPSYYYITQGVYAAAGIFYYTFPLTFGFAYVNEVYRAEIILRNMDRSKQTIPYYNPFYPVYYFSYKY